MTFEIDLFVFLFATIRFRMGNFNILLVCSMVKTVYFAGNKFQAN